MKKILFLILVFIFFSINAALSLVINGSVSLTDKLPDELFGSWRVEAVCIKTTNQEYFELASVDIWTLSRNGETVTLSNPISGARADISVNDIKGKTVKFIKKSFYGDEESIETPILTLQGDNFTGIDKINIKTYEKGKLIREDYVEYKVRGTKISGVSALGIFGMH